MSDATVRVVAFNIRNGRAFDGWNSWPFRRRATARAIRRLRPDVVGLQEAYRCQERYLVRQLDGMAAFGRGRDVEDRGERCPLLWRTDRLRASDLRVRWFADRPDDPGSRLPGSMLPRVGTTGRFEMESAPHSPFGVANIHLDHTDAANRRRSAVLLVEWLAGDLPWVVMGDFNEPRNGGAHAVLADAGFVSVLPRDSPGTFHRFTKRRDGALIDDILVRGPWTVHDAAVSTDEPGRPASDHWPISADLTLGG